MQNLSNLISLARLSGPWATGRIARVRSRSSRSIRRLTTRARAFEPCRLPAPVPLPVRVPRLRADALVPALMLVATLASPAFAARGSRFELTSDGRLVDVQVLVDGHAAPLYFPTNGYNRRYVQAFRGRNYALALTNNTGCRIGVLIAVDGLNVVNGQRSRLASDEAMYVLDPWERTVIRGWRSSLNDVRKFVFVDEERSYAERTGQANGDLGWIRVLAFNEQGRRWFEESPGRINDRDPRRNDEGERFYDLREQKGGDEPRVERAVPAPLPSEGQSQEGDVVGPRKELGATKSLQRDDAPAAPSVPGTGWGEKRWDPVRRVWFVPERQATDHLVFRYEYASGLRALGIFPRGTRDRIREREDGELGFAQPPRW